jgi:hypothetical protein
VESVMTFSFRQSEDEHVAIDVLRYERSPMGDYHDDNWLAVRVRVCAGGFRASVGAAIQTAELPAFLSQLRPLCESLDGTAVFTSLEEQLWFRLVGDGKGTFEFDGEIADKPGPGNRLHVTLRLDRSQLQASIRELEGVVSEFPIRA